MDEHSARRREPEPVLAALRLSKTAMRIIPGAPARAWMDATKIRFANRCLPMLIANQHGWDVVNDGRFTATWNGGDLPGDTTVTLGDPRPSERPEAHFGAGIITWTLPFLFRTPPGWNLLARGPVNAPKDGIAPLEGIIETDWTHTPFTMNWKITRAGYPIVFEPGEIICRLVPQRRGELQQFTARYGDIDESPDTAAAFRAWSAARRSFSSDPANVTGWQKEYFRGDMPAGGRFEEHETRLTLAPFDKPSNAPANPASR